VAFFNQHFSSKEAFVNLSDDKKSQSLVVLVVIGMLLFGMTKRSSKSIRPDSLPPFAHQMLSLIPCGPNRSSIVGDLYEEYEDKLEQLDSAKANRWLAEQVLYSFMPLLFSYLKHRISVWFAEWLGKLTK
jgi:hypothetical protein